MGFDPEMAGWAAAADATIGRVARVDGGLARVLTEERPVLASFGGNLLAEMGADATTAPCTGDWCVVREWPDHRITLETVMPRRTSVVFAPGCEHPRGEVLCSNIDYAAVVVALHAASPVARVRRLLALARQSGAKPLVVLTKSDLVPGADRVAASIAENTPGVELICTSTVTGTGLSRLHDLIDGRLTVALLGASGHGKSSLVNALVGAQVLTAKESRDDGRGRHPSVRRELVVLPTGGAVIDTPGINGVGLMECWEKAARQT
jgi:ribosome biogenesis GTPase